MSADFGCEALCPAVSVRNAAVSMKLAERLAPLSHDAWTIVNGCGSSSITCPLISEDNSVNEEPAVAQVTPPPARQEHQDTSGPIFSNTWGLNFGGFCM